MKKNQRKFHPWGLVPRRSASLGEMTVCQFARNAITWLIDMIEKFENFARGFLKNKIPRNFDCQLGVVNRNIVIFIVNTPKGLLVFVKTRMIRMGLDSLYLRAAAIES
jgi:hypothetical protein